MENDIKKIIFFSVITIIFLTILTILIVINTSNLEYSIIHPNGGDSFYLITNIECNEYQLKNETFLFPLDYQKRDRIFYENLNDTYARGCWYDTLLVEDLTLEWVTENCNITKRSILEKEFSCDKGFLVKITI